MSQRTYFQKREWTTKYNARLRKAALDVLGGKCIKCGFSDIRALQVDHVNGGGTKDKKKTTHTYFKIVVESFLKGENKYQLLCANCNWIKRYENKEIYKKYTL
jgi:hypothetical protein